MNKEQVKELEVLIDAMEEHLKEATYQMNELRIKRHEIIRIIRNQNENNI